MRAETRYFRLRVGSVARGCVELDPEWSGNPPGMRSECAVSSGRCEKLKFRRNALRLLPLRPKNAGDHDGRQVAPHESARTGGRFVTTGLSGTCGSDAFSAAKMRGVWILNIPVNIFR